MSPLVWDEVGKRTYQDGVDRGVLYLDGLVEVWNGLTKVEDSTPGRGLPSYQDGIKYMEYRQLSEFEGALSAFTYPDLFERALGITADTAGFNLHDQDPKPFSLSYRTYLGDDLQGISRGYIIHLLYNLYAISDTIAYTTIANTHNPTEFSWKLTSVPISHSAGRPTAHISINSTKISPASLLLLEKTLYGQDYEPYLPSLPDVVYTITNPNQPLTVADNGDGTWTANGSFEDIRMISNSEFEVDNPNAVYTDPDTYTMPTT